MQMRTTFGLVLVAAVSSAQAVVITPTYTTFGNLTLAQIPIITFGGSGIGIASPVAITTFNSVAAPATTVLLAMSATPRVSGAFVGTPLTSNGAGTYFAQLGSSPPGGSNNAGWNFNYAAIGDTRGLSFELYADTNPGLGSNVPLVLSVPGLTLNASAGSAQNTQGSQNLGFAPWDTPFIFNPNAVGQYSFSLRAFNGATPVGEVSMQVNVVPEPEAYGMALAGIAVLSIFGLRRKAAAPKA
jgi:hypothetical protein